VELWIPEQDGRDAIGELPGDVSCHLFPRIGPPPDEILRAEFLVPSHATRGLRRLLREMGELRVIQTLSAGVDWLLPFAPTDVTLCDARGARDGAVSEWVLASILALTKDLPELRDRQREHVWHAIEPDDLAGRTVTILGYGSIGKAVEARLAPFGVDVLRVARSARSEVHCVQELPSLLSSTEILIVLLPFTPETEGLLDAGTLACLPPGALLINAARGRIVDQAALLELLRARRLRAALDVTDPEPLPGDHPLWDAPGVMITPHLAGDSPLASRSAFQLVGEQVRRSVSGEPLSNVVEADY
jgi:phosphoglycerate dehydrogenase-like enzyme